MAADIKTKYPATDTVALTISPASLASSSTLVEGRASTVVDNSSNLDLDHLLQGYVTLGTSPSADTVVEFWLYAAASIASGTPAYPDGITGSDAAQTMTSRNLLANSLVLAHTGLADNVTDRQVWMPKKSVAALFGGVLPVKWGLFVVHNTGVALNATGGNHVLHYERVQQQTA